MSNAFGFVLDDASLRRAAVEGVPETVIAAIYLLHERSVGEVAAKLRPDELEHVIRLVGRCPSCYPLGTLDALKSKRMASLTPTAGSLLPSATTKEEVAAHPRPQHRRPPAAKRAFAGCCGWPRGRRHSIECWFARAFSKLAHASPPENAQANRNVRFGPLDQCCACFLERCGVARSPFSRLRSPFRSSAISECA